MKAILLSMNSSLSVVVKSPTNIGRTAQADIMHAAVNNDQTAFEVIVSRLRAR